jgi:hypothetical protein
LARSCRINHPQVLSRRPAKWRRHMGKLLSIKPNLPRNPAPQSATSIPGLKSRSRHRPAIDRFATAITKCRHDARLCRCTAADGRQARYCL